MTLVLNWQPWEAYYEGNILAEFAPGAGVDLVQVEFDGSSWNALLLKYEATDESDDDTDVYENDPVLIDEESGFLTKEGAQEWAEGEDFARIDIGEEIPDDDEYWAQLLKDEGFDE